MTVRNYSWLAGTPLKGGVMAPLKPAEGLAEGRILTDAERKAWRVLWADRVARGVPPAVPPSMFHPKAADCEGTCPNGVHGQDR